MSDTPESKPDMPKSSQTVTLPMPIKAQVKEILGVIADGIGAVRRGTFSGHECKEIGRLLLYLENLRRDMQRDYDKMPDDPPMPTFGPAWKQGQKETGEAIANKEEVPA